MADDYAQTHKMSSKSRNPQQKRYHGSGNRENISRNMDDRKRQGKSTENVGLVIKVEPLKTISCGHCGKPGHIITNCWKLGGNVVNIVVNLPIKVRIVELLRISCKKKLNPQG